eukprot:2255626-Prorocentrum_lima.AAC.1
MAVAHVDDFLISVDPESVVAKEALRMIRNKCHSMWCQSGTHMGPKKRLRHGDLGHAGVHGRH